MTDTHQSDPHQSPARESGGYRSYLALGLALALSLIVMYALTFSMINTLDDFALNLSNFYMALTMVFPMGIIMILVMWRMFPRRALNIVLLAGFAVAFVSSFLLGRASAFIGDDQFLASMIPHHSRAILVCQESSLDDREIIDLCAQIVRTQQEEIDQMRDIQDRLAGTDDAARAEWTP